jgi:hypothetical protein
LALFFAVFHKKIKLNESRKSKRRLGDRQSNKNLWKNVEKLGSDWSSERKGHAATAE